MIYFVAEIDVRLGKAARFDEIMSALVPPLKSRGWRLVAAYTTVVGRLGRVINIWEVDDANAVPSVLAVLGADPAFSEIVAELSEIIDVETTTLLAKTSYSG
jgi:hypothetical protein